MYNKLYLGDCIQVLKSFTENSIDCVVSDPPYGIAFMGKEWDKVLPSKEAFEQMFRVLKPGALAFIMSSPRQDVLWRMLRMLEECGFELRQSFISWIYKTGFPKAMDVGKGIDKKFNVKRKQIKVDASKVRNPKSIKGGHGIEGGDRPWLKEAIIKGYHEKDSDIPITELAKQWDGWKSITGLKPALECILMVNKPMSESTIVDNVLKHGTGAMNVDACRIPCNDLPEKWKGNTPSGSGRYAWNLTKNKNEYVGGSNSKGRFPANLLCSSAIDIDIKEILKLQEVLKNEKS